ncbi:MAG: DASS family sodium-coupled anion symporter [Coxiellaceae bacterium]|nr:DASS family sodium-coupled anion symporter [Coxiellaceae bacterium]
MDVTYSSRYYKYMIARTAQRIVAMNVGLFLGPVVFLTVLLSPKPDLLSVTGWHTIAMAALMVVWWVTEAIPLYITAMLPLLLAPLLGIHNIKTAAAPYANPVIFLFFGGFMLAQAVQRWSFHRRVALKILLLMQGNPSRIIAGFMVATAFLSMWISNTATTILMLPIALSIINTMDGDEQYAKALLLAIAYSASIGGMGTLVGTPPNALLAAYLSQSANYDLSFSEWSAVAVPLVVVSLPLVYWLITRVIFRVPKTSQQNVELSQAVIRQEYAELGRLQRPEVLIMIIFLLTAVLWVVRPLLGSVIPGITDTGISIFATILLFITPINLKQGEFVLNWEWAKKIHWEVLLLFGGGLSLASAVKSSQLSGWIGQYLSDLHALPLPLVVIGVLAAILFLTELTSNTATIAIFLPVIALFADAIKLDPIYLLIPATLTASCAFMLPTATAPNAVVFSGGNVRITDMLRAGFVLNILFVVLVSILSFILIHFQLLK